MLFSRFPDDLNHFIQSEVRRECTGSDANNLKKHVSDN